MKIIDNKKDYYDYVSGIYGIDPYVVYDRRNSVSSSTIMNMSGWNEMFSKNALSTDSIHRAKYGILHPYGKRFIDCDYKLTIEAGEKHFYILCTRIRETKDSPIELKYRVYDPIEDLKSRYSHYSSLRRNWVEEEIARYKQKRSKAPLAIFYTDCSYYRSSSETHEIENPILKDLPITGLIPAEEIWKGIYEYLLKMKEPNVVDNRTDIEHIESAGFDKKTSFRNM